MVSRYLASAFWERPDYFLALALSAPPTAASQRSLQVTFVDDDAVVLRRTHQPRDFLRIASTKSTIREAILLYELVVQRGPDRASDLLRTIDDYALELASSAVNPDHAGELFEGSEYRSLHSYLDVTGEDFLTAEAKTREALRFLEEQDLAVDPGFTPEFMILLGLVPLQFSVRTPRGQRVYRELKIGAALWSLAITRGIHDDKPFTDVDFKFRGLDIVRTAITAMAAQYLKVEEGKRRAAGRPTVRPPGPPRIDTDEHDT